MVVHITTYHPHDSLKIYFGLSIAISQYKYTTISGNSFASSIKFLPLFLPGDLVRASIHLFLNVIKTDKGSERHGEGPSPAGRQDRNDTTDRTVIVNKISI